MRADRLTHRRKVEANAPRILIVGAGFAGLHCARELERRLRPGEASITLASPADYMLYSPLLPHVAAGNLTPPDVAVPLRRALHRTLRVPCQIIGVDLDGRACIARTILGEKHVVRWDRLVLCPGAVTRTFAIPGLERYGRGMKTLAEARHLHDHVLAELELGNTVSDPRRRAAHCTFVVVGAGYAGSETAAVLQSFTARALDRFLNLRRADLRWILVDVASQVLPELGERLGTDALGMLRRLGIEVRLGTSVREVRADDVVLSDGDVVPSRTLVRTAGVTANPLMSTLGLPTGRSERLIVTSQLQVPERPDVFAAGDAAAVPDLRRPGGEVTPPTAQHAQRQGKTLARNVVRSLRGEQLLSYEHHDLGLVVDLGGVRAVARPVGVGLSGLPAQVVARGYHLSALPSLRAKAKAAADWVAHASFGDDFVRVGSADPDRGGLSQTELGVEYLRQEAVRESARTLPSRPD